MLEVDLASQIEILNKAICILQSTNTIAKVVNPTILLLRMGR